MKAARKRTKTEKLDHPTNNYAFLWIYGDDDDDNPCLLVNPPENIEQLLTEWNKLDRLMVDGQPGGEDWKEIDVWLKEKGVILISVKNILLLDDYLPDTEEKTE